MLPTHGAATGVFLLANAARYRDHETVDAWVATARDRSSFMAGAVDLEACAQDVLRLGLVDPSGSVALHPALARLWERADRTTLVEISSLLLKLDPPPWLQSVVHEGAVSREYVPADDLRALAWLDPLLDQLLIDAAEALGQSHLDPLRAALGRAGELVVMAAAAKAGLTPVHVADLSDAYGYDIELGREPVHRIEVKATTEAKAGTFHLSRNEFEKCIRYGQEWRLVQVTFDSSIFVAEAISAAQVTAINELTCQELAGRVPADTPSFRWTESAVITAPTNAWSASSLEVPPALQLPGIRQLAASISKSAVRTR